MQNSQPIGPLVTFSPPPLPGRVVLDGKWATLVPLHPTIHGDALWEQIGQTADQDRWIYMGSGPFANREDFDTFLKRMASANDPLMFAILDRSTGLAVGIAAYLRIDAANGGIEVGHLTFGSALQQTPAATEAMYLMARYALDELGYRRYEWKCNGLNAPSRRAALRLGFTYEGTFRNHMVVKGRNRDTAWFSITREEWPRCRRALELCLDASNFDPDGRQRRPLAEVRASLES